MHALVVGTSGVIGSSIAAQLVKNEMWVVTCATHGGQLLDCSAGLAVDLLGLSSVKPTAGALKPVTHRFFAIFQSRLPHVAPSHRLADSKSFASLK
jgi:hypothetical protein